MKLKVLSFIVLLLSCSAMPPPAIGPLSQFASLAPGSSWTDLTALGGPAMGMSSELLHTLAGLAKAVFAVKVVGTKAVVGAIAGVKQGPGLPPPLPPLPKAHKLAPWAVKHEMLLDMLVDKWSGALVKAQFSPGLQGFLSLLGLQEKQEALIKWVCIVYPWDALIPDALRDLRNAYCTKALPAAAVSRILAGPGPLLAVGPGPGVVGPHPPGGALLG